MILPWHIVKEICEDNGVDIKLMQATPDGAEHVSFYMMRVPHDTKVYGLCNGTKVTFNVAGKRQEYDLADPSSISKMSSYLSSEIWADWDLGTLDDHNRSRCRN